MALHKTETATENDLYKPTLLLCCRPLSISNCVGSQFFQATINHHSRNFVFHTGATFCDLITSASQLGPCDVTPISLNAVSFPKFQRAW